MSDNGGWLPWPEVCQVPTSESVEAFDESALSNYRRAVRSVHPAAGWLTGEEFGRIVAGDRLISLKFILIDNRAKARALFDDSQRLGSEYAWTARQVDSSE